jgi:hypothetical protein
MDFSERGECKPVLLGFSLAGNLVKPLLSLHGTEWRDRGYGLWGVKNCFYRVSNGIYLPMQLFGKIRTIQ